MTHIARQLPNFQHASGRIFLKNFLVFALSVGLPGTGMTMASLSPDLVCIAPVFPNTQPDRPSEKGVPNASWKLTAVNYRGRANSYLAPHAATTSKPSRAPLGHPDLPHERPGSRRAFRSLPGEAYRSRDGQHAAAERGRAGRPRQEAGSARMHALHGACGVAPACHDQW